ncbi:alpha/beta fold hydrolase [Rubrivirga marina]|uniref:Alpha/beta hydrolase n=1 Tax=Rubrivirga marina TaxID=1196024 RepID=A0A271J068_9BACT|nr:alpha/beta hydrolase [Rubrivirga marina]PAP76444.1 alpha/beta hydrolase [Rubrivirga marina]
MSDLPDLGVPLRSRFAEGTGVRLHVVEAGPADGPLVLLLHGFPEFWFGWRHQLPALAAAGYRVWAPDQRGYNRSDAPPETAAYTLDRLADDGLALLDAAGADRARVVGHDWGAVVAWWLALRDPERVDRLAILNVPHPVAFRQFLRRPSVQWLRSWYMAFFQIPALPEIALRRLGARALRVTSAPGTFSDADLARYREAWSRPGAARGMLAWYRAAARYGLGDRGLDPTVRPPTLILWGDADAALDARLAERSAALCADVRLRMVPGVSHWVQHEAPAVVNAELLAFLGAPREKATAARP